MKLNSSGKAKTTDAQSNYDKKFRREGQWRIFLVVMFLLCAIVLTAIFFLKIWQRRPQPRFMFLTEEWLANDLTVDALIIRDETVYNAPVDGMFRSFIPQGSKVAKSSRLGQMFAVDSEELLKKLDKANNDVHDRRYELLAEGKGGNAARIFEANQDAIRRNLHVYYDGLAQEDVSKMAELEMEMRLLIEQRLEDAKLFDFEDEELNRLIATRDRLEEVSLDSIREIYSEASGIFIRQLDGFEIDLTPEKAFSLSAGEIKKYLSISKAPALVKTAKTGEDLYKLARSPEQIFLCVVPNQYLSLVSDLENVSSIRIYSPANGIDIDTVKLQRQETSSQGTILAFSTRQNLEAFASMRKVPLHIYLNEAKGLKLPKTALLNYDEGNTQSQIKIIKGGFVHVAQVNILRSNDEYALIEGVGESAEDVQVSTMILLNPDSMEEGEALAESY